MAATRLEHVNLVVRDLDGMVRFLQAAFPEFRIRGEGTGPSGARWLHIASDETDLALNEATVAPAEPWVPYSGRPGVNHRGFEVDAADALRARLRAAGYDDTTVPNEHPGRSRV